MDLSWVLGRLGPQGARASAFGSGDDYRPGKDAVRHVRVGDLRSAGFTVEHTPRIGSLDHVSVYWHQGFWGDSEAELLNSRCMGGEV